MRPRSDRGNKEGSAGDETQGDMRNDVIHDVSVYRFLYRDEKRGCTGREGGWLHSNLFIASQENSDTHTKPRVLPDE
jgi:hypothetical protein